LVFTSNDTLRFRSWLDDYQVPCLLRSVEELWAGGEEEVYSHCERTDEDLRDVLKSTYGEHIDSLNKFKVKGRIVFKCSLLCGRNLSYCFKYLRQQVEGERNQVHTRSVHAEENAFLQIAKYSGQPLRGGILFTTASPCELCAKKAYQLGISKIYYIDPYPGIAERHVLKSGSKQPELILFWGPLGALIINCISLRWSAKHGAYAGPDDAAHTAWPGPRPYQILWS